MTSSIGGGLDDAIAAKLSLDLPANSEEILKSVSRYTYEIKTNMEATARATMDYTTYLESFPALQRAASDAQERQLGILRDTLSTIEKIKSAGPVYTNTIAGASPAPDNQFNTRTNDSGRIIPVAPDSGNAGQGRFNPSDQQSYNSARSGHLPGTIYDHNGNVIGNQNNSPGNQGPRGPAAAPNWPAVSDQDIMRQAERDAEIDRQRRIRERAAERRAVVDPLGGNSHPDSNGRMYDSRGNLVRNDDGTPRLLGNRRGGTPDPDGDANTPNGPPDQGGGGSRGGGGGGRRGGGGGYGEPGGNPGGLGSFADTINDNLGLATGVLSPGVPLASRLAMASRLAQQVAQSGALGAGASSALGMASGVGGGLAIAGAGFNAVQQAGQAIQGFRNMDVQDHTLAGGLGIQKDIMMMSLNPLLSSEQSREIIMASLKSGYSEGKGYDTVTEYIKDNLVEMNISVADSVKLLKTNVEAGRSSIEALKLSLDTVMDASSNGPQTRDEAAKSLDQLTAQLTANGVVNGSAPQTAELMSQLFNTRDENGVANPLLENSVQIQSELLGSQAFNARLGQDFAPGKAPGEIQAFLSETGVLPGAIDSILKKEAQDSVKAFPGDDGMAFESFKSKMKGTYGLTLDDGKLKNLFGQYKAERTPYEIARQNLDETKSSNVNGQNAGNLQTFEQFTALPGNKDKTREDWEKDVLGTPDGESGAALNTKHLADFAKRYPQAVAIDPDGKAHLLDPDDVNQAIGLANGSWKIAKAPGIKDGEVERGNDGYLVKSPTAGRSDPNGILATDGTGDNPNRVAEDKLDVSVYDNTKSFTMGQFEAAGGDPEKAGWTAEDGNIDYRGDNEKGGGGRFGTSIDAGGNPNGLTDQQMIGLTPEARRLFMLSPLNPSYINNSGTTENSNSGYGSAQRNDQQPSDRVGPWGMGGN